MSLVARLEQKTKELDRIANLWNKTKDPKYKKQWYALLKQVPSASVSEQ
jgi:hypothetical protein